MERGDVLIIEQREDVGLSRFVLHSRQGSATVTEDVHTRVGHEHAL
jgi:hypothetical protein